MYHNETITKTHQTLELARVINVVADPYYGVPRNFFGISEHLLFCLGLL